MTFAVGTSSRKFGIQYWVLNSVGSWKNGSPRALFWIQNCSEQWVGKNGCNGGLQIAACLRSHITIPLLRTTLL